MLCMNALGRADWQQLEIDAMKPHQGRAQGCAVGQVSCRSLEAASEHSLVKEMSLEFVNLPLNVAR